MEHIVLDASVVVKWFKKKNEQHSKQAETLLQNFLSGTVRVSIPTLLFTELVSIAAFDHTVSEEHWQEALVFLFSLTWHVYPPDQFFIKDTYQLAKGLGLSAYDATYLAVAKRCNAVVVTEDKELLAKGGNLVRAL